MYDVKISIVMAAYDRPHLLRYGLTSLHKEAKEIGAEIVVVNDFKDNDGTREVCEEFPDLNIKYFFSGTRNINRISPMPRNPCVPNNIAFKKSTGDIIFLTCPEIFHFMDESIRPFIDVLLVRKNVMAIPNGLYMDEDAKMIEYFKTKGTEKQPAYEFCSYNIRQHLDLVEMPFFMGIWREHFEEIGGYDEDFELGYAGEDNDLVNRFKLKGLTYAKLDIPMCHLWHGRNGGSLEMRLVPKDLKKRWNRNILLLNSRKNTLVRNKHKAWGKL